MDEMDDPKAEPVPPTPLELNSQGGTSARVQPVSGRLMTSLATAPLTWVRNERLRDRLQEPINEITAHAIICIYTAIVIYVIGLVLRFLGLGDKTLFGTNITTDDWFRYIDIISVTIMAAIGIKKCAVKMNRE
jgi:biotin transporter BioY